MDTSVQCEHMYTDIVNPGLTKPLACTVFSDCSEKKNWKHEICSLLKKQTDGRSRDVVWPIFAPSVIAIMKDWVLTGGSWLFMSVCLGCPPQNLCEQTPWRDYVKRLLVVRLWRFNIKFDTDWLLTEHREKAKEETGWRSLDGKLIFQLYTKTDNNSE